MFLDAPPLVLLSFPIALTCAALSDVRRFIIPNTTCVALVAGFAFAFVFSGLGWNALGGHLASGLGGFILGFALFAFGIWGGGDGKLLAATALWFDPAALFALVALISMIGGALGIVGIVVSRKAHVLVMLPGALGRVDYQKYGQIAPYGVAIGLGALLAFPATDLFRAYCL